MFLDSKRLFEIGKEAVLSVDDAAALFGKHPKTIQRWIRLKRIPFRYDAGDKPVFFLSELVAWLDRRKGFKPR